jgi:putative hydrolase of the HAD superfamily
VIRRTPSLVLLDLDGVLVDYDRGARVRHLADAVGVDAATVHDALFASGLEDRFDAGMVDADEYLHALGHALGANVDREHWAAARGAAMRLDPALPPLLRRIGARCELAVLTNNGGLLIDCLPALLPSLTDALCGRLLCSARLGATKPDPRVFHAAIAALRHEAGTTLFVDDAPANVEGALHAGLMAEHVASPRDLAAALARYGLD